VTIEQLVRAVTLFGTAWTKAAVFENLPPELFAAVNLELRTTLFQEVIEIIGRDQFSEVNELVPAVENHLGSVPAELHADFVMAILKHAWSDARRGAPAARRMLAELPEPMVTAALPRLDDKDFLYWYARQDAVQRFVSKYVKLAQPQQEAKLKDLITLPEREFRDKYYPDRF
jgi:hypothetical protein